MLPEIEIKLSRDIPALLSLIEKGKVIKGFIDHDGLTLQVNISYQDNYTIYTLRNDKHLIRNHFFSKEREEFREFCIKKALRYVVSEKLLGDEQLEVSRNSSVINETSFSASELLVALPDRIMIGDKIIAKVFEGRYIDLQNKLFAKINEMIAINLEIQKILSEIQEIEQYSTPISRNNPTETSAKGENV